VLPSLARWRVASAESSPRSSLASLNFESCSVTLLRGPTRSAQQREGGLSVTLGAVVGVFRSQDRHGREHGGSAFLPTPPLAEPGRLFFDGGGDNR
jgi:hypothetical protein